MTRIAQWREDLRTRVALTPTEPLPTFEPWISPTPEMGLTFCGNGNMMLPQTLNIWRGVVDDEIMVVAAGFEGNFDDPFQGLVLVFHGPRCDPTDPATEIYRTPQRVGPVRIAAVDGLRFVVVPVDPRTPGAVVTPWATQSPGVVFTFDLTTRQWVTPEATPVASPSLSPVASPQVSPSSSP